MTAFAFILIFVSAFIHATWNLLAKRVSNGLAFVFLINLLSTLIYSPIAITALWAQNSSVSGITILTIAGSAIIHVFYFMLLQKGYQVGDLSLVYPLARGTGPLLSSLSAIVLLKEQPTLMAILGIFCIVGGVMLLTGNPFKIWQSGFFPPIIYGLLTGVLIACYTLWDKYAVSYWQVSPLLLNYGCNLFETILLAPIAVMIWPAIRQEWRVHQQEVLGVAFLSPIAYILVLIAMTFTPLTYVAPIRELSILVGAVMGHRLLAEGEGIRRLIASGIMVLGILTLAFN